MLAKGGPSPWMVGGRLTDMGQTATQYKKTERTPIDNRWTVRRKTLNIGPIEGTKKGWVVGG